MGSTNIKLKEYINASPIEVYTAFTNAAALCEWLCNVAQAADHEHGRLYLWWKSGYYASGEYTSLKEGEKITFSWHGREEPGKSQVRIAIQPTPDGALLKLEHSDLGSGKAWRNTAREIERGWKVGLANLKSVLETGQDLRLLNQPTLGVTCYDFVNEKYQTGKTRSGIRLRGVPSGLSAHKAGLQSGDLIVKIGSHKLVGPFALDKLLDSHSPGKSIRAVYYRQGKKCHTELTLSAHNLPDMPANAQSLTERVEDQYRAFLNELEAVLHTADEEQVRVALLPDDWSILHILAHLVITEREMQSWITGLIEGQEADVSLHTNTPSRLDAMIANYPSCEAMMDELRRNFFETSSLLRSLPDELITRKRSFWRLGYAIMESQQHIHTHLEQIRDILRRSPLRENAESTDGQIKMDADEPHRMVAEANDQPSL